jgi:hypothetical protein
MSGSYLDLSFTTFVLWPSSLRLESFEMRPQRVGPARHCLEFLPK